MWSTWEDELAHQMSAAQRRTHRHRDDTGVVARLDVTARANRFVLDRTFRWTCNGQRSGQAGRAVRVDEPPPS